MKKLIQDWIYLSRMERRSIYGLTLLLALALLIRLLCQTLFPPQFSPLAAEKITLEALVIDSVTAAWKFEKEFTIRKGKRKYWLPAQRLCPDTLTELHWQAFGLSEKQARAIKKWEALLGGYHDSADFMTIKVVPEEWKLACISMLDFSPRTSEKKTFNKKSRKYGRVEINAATLEELDSLPGIGAKLSKRILLYRDKLGGFASLEQLLEVFGVDTALWISLQPYLLCSGEVRKRALNYAPRDSLAAIPYLGKRWAGVIVNDRNRNGFYRKVEDLRTRSVLPDSIFEKMQFYVFVQGESP